MPIIRLLLLVAFGFGLLAGCDNSEEFVVTSNDNRGGATPGGFVVFQHVLAREVPSGVSTFRISGLNAEGELEYQPTDFPKAPELVVEMPISVAHIAVLYLDSSQTPQAAFFQEVELVAGERTTIADPGLVYPSAPPAPSTTTTWHNDSCPLDVNADGKVSPLDALLLINDLNQNGTRQLTDFTSQPFPPPPFLDVNADGSVTMADSLGVINALNSGNLTVCPPAVAPAKLVVASQPQDVVAGQVLTPIEVRILGANDQVASKSFHEVTISFLDDGGFALGGTTTRTALKGVAVFDDLTVAGEGFQVFLVQATDLSSAQSEPFTVSAPLLRAR